MNGKTADERRLIELVEEGLSSPTEPDDPASWQKRREALRGAVDDQRDRKRAKLSS